ncbi:MAG: glycosyltransferase [Thermomicrobiales bacterium]
MNGTIIKRKKTAVVGSIAPHDIRGPVRLTLFVDGVAASEGRAQRTRGGRRSFRLDIPSAWFDGLPHHLALMDSNSGRIIGELVEILPGVSAPGASLQRYGGLAAPTLFAPAAARRYVNLRHWLAASDGREAESGNDRRLQLSQAHEVLVRGVDPSAEMPRLKFRWVDDPTVSVIVPVHDNVALTYHCLAALLFAYNAVSFEVIVVDDGSRDATVSLPEHVEGITYLRNSEAKGFVRACNRGADHARGQYLAFLNNDTETTLHWLDELLFVFNTFDDVGLAGSRLVFPNGRLQAAGGIIWDNGNVENYGSTCNPEDPRFTYTRQVDYLPGASIMLPRSVWTAVGGFSEEFCPAYFEDTDLAFKVREIGKRVVYAPLSLVYHHEGASSGAGTDSDTKKYQDINHPTFKRRWIYAYQSNGPEGSNVELVKDRNVSLRALVIDQQVPRPNIDAGGYAALQEIRLLQSLGCKVTFLPLDLAYAAGYTQALQRLGVECLFAPHVTSIGDLLAARGREFDVVYITRFSVASHVMAEVRRFAPQAKILFCNADLHFLRILRTALLEHDYASLKEAKAVRASELQVMRDADVVLSYSAIEHAVILSHNFARTKVVTAPWVVDVTEEAPPFEARSGIAFLGGFAHPPNFPAVEFFITEVMPLLRQRLPGVLFHVYGSNVPDELRALACDDVRIEGFVEDVSLAYDRRRVFVAPLLVGAGLKGKVLDALAHGTPSVLSPIAAEGIGVRNGIEAFIAETPEQWARAIEALYHDPLLWENVSQAARDHARTAYSFRRGQELMVEALEVAGIRRPDLRASQKTLVARTARPAFPAECQVTQAKPPTESAIRHTAGTRQSP